MHWDPFGTGAGSFKRVLGSRLFDLRKEPCKDTECSEKYQDHSHRPVAADQRKPPNAANRLIKPPRVTSARSQEHPTAEHERCPSRVDVIQPFQGYREGNGHNERGDIDGNKQSNGDAALVG